jgi:large subunit ribosomal protein L23
MGIILKPVVTEKMTTQTEEHNRYGFVVENTANKVQIRVAIEALYGVSVKSVNTQRYIGKIKTRNTTRGLAVGRANRHKKAIVTLVEGDTIDFYSGI